jgi:hypothetical protein
LEADPDCFQKKTMTAKLSLKDKLHHLLKAPRKGNGGREAQRLLLVGWLVGYYWLQNDGRD